MQVLLRTPLISVQDLEILDDHCAYYPEFGECVYLLHWSKQVSHTHTYIYIHTYTYTCFIEGIANQPLAANCTLNLFFHPARNEQSISSFANAAQLSMASEPHWKAKCSTTPRNMNEQLEWRMQRCKRRLSTSQPPETSTIKRQTIFKSTANKQTKLQK